MYAEWSPEPALAGRIACLWRQVSEDDRTQLVVPDACVDLIWGPSGPFVAGPDTGPVPTSMHVGDIFTGIRFKPGATGEVFGVPLSELRDQRVPLDALGALPPLDDAPDPMPVLRAAIADRLRRTPPPDPAAPAAAAALRRGDSVREVAWELGLSERQLHRRSVASFGYAPKTLQRIVRFQHALRLARSGVPLAEVAAVAGYADQAHLSRDVRRLSGVTLSRLAA
ncbi:helix-turn-helix transcriptional regulator [Nonomuraea sp. NPDC049486]|uniref:helix-turn-helix transcriptional regulator n=1 Tax=Nonomuraea sp. NPDC049486 TaxID=3155773 RepID=UPI00343BE2AB